MIIYYARIEMNEFLSTPVFVVLRNRKNLKGLINCAFTLSCL